MIQPMRLVTWHFRRVVLITSRPGPSLHKLLAGARWGLCWAAATWQGCRYYDLFTCPSCRLLLPFSCGVPDRRECADCSKVG